MRPSNRELPRYWPILFVLDCAGTLRNNFHLQKILYLAQVEHHIPIPYTFIRETYGPYSRAIKADFISLASEGLINLEYGPGWVFTITSRGRDVIKTICALLDEKTHKAFRACVEKWSRKGLHELRQYIYDKHLPSEEVYLQVRTESRDLARTLMDQVAEYPTSSNKLLLMGMLDYTAVALDKEALKDPAQRNHVLRAALQLIDRISDIYDETNANRKVLAELGLGTLRENFDHFQEVCEQYRILPSLYDENVDLAALIR